MGVESSTVTHYLQLLIVICLLRPHSALHCLLNLLLSADLPALTPHLHLSQLLPCSDRRVFSLEVQAFSFGSQVIFPETDNGKYAAFELYNMLLDRGCHCLTEEQRGRPLSKIK